VDASEDSEEAMTDVLEHPETRPSHQPIPEFVEMIADLGAGLYACKASVDLFELTKDDFVPQV
jgi:predicted peroxiredoxin